MIPVSVVTGFLGSGKTTLISRVLRDPRFGRTAVIVSEFGEVALDHDLIASSDDSVLTLNTGCLCCAVQTDLARTLMTLFQRRAAGSVAYDRVLIETSGLSEPAPVLQAIMLDGGVSATHQLPYVVTLADAIHGETTLREHVQARHQVALADRILISKTDLRATSERLVAALDALNPDCPRMTTMAAAPEDLFGAGSFAVPDGRLNDVSSGRGHAGVESTVILRERPLPALVLTMLLQAVVEHCGGRLLRLKGLVAIEEMPGQPAVVHGVRHVVSPPEFLDRWPSSDERTRIVLITTGVPRYFAAKLLDAIEEEVRDAALASRAAFG
ncbi:MAG TPA: GTP-binding protein [Rhodopila sp.]|jgi:G3E family GTPase|nr:GTP-binding protein [Rhodopila sp.]